MYSTTQDFLEKRVCHLTMLGRNGPLAAWRSGFSKLSGEVRKSQLDENSDFYRSVLASVLHLLK
jgi:hypothetical protein